MFYHSYALIPLDKRSWSYPTWPHAITTTSPEEKDWTTMLATCKRTRHSISTDPSEHYAHSMAPRANKARCKATSLDHANICTARMQRPADWPALRPLLGPEKLNRSRSLGCQDPCLPARQRSPCGQSMFGSCILYRGRRLPAK